MVWMPGSTSFRAFSIRQPSRRRASMKLAAEGSTIVFWISRPPASRSRSSTCSRSVFCLPVRRES